MWRELISECVVFCFFSVHFFFGITWVSSLISLIWHYYNDCQNMLVSSCLRFFFIIWFFLIRLFYPCFIFVPISLHFIFIFGVLFGVYVEKSWMARCCCCWSYSFFYFFLSHRRRSSFFSLVFRCFFAYFLISFSFFYAYFLTSSPLFHFRSDECRYCFW